VAFKYNFYPPNGTGRDTYVTNASVNQSIWSYQQAPVFSGNLQNGMANSVTSTKYTRQARPYTSVGAVSGYTGHIPAAIHSVGTSGLPAPSAVPLNKPFPLGEGHVVAPVGSGNDPEFARQTARIASKTYKIPGYAGHTPGLIHSVGKSYGGVAAGESNEAIAARTSQMYPPNMMKAHEGAHKGVLGFGLEFEPRNLQDAAFPMEPLKAPTQGYTGWMQMRSNSANFGKPWGVKAPALPNSGGIGDPGREFIADVAKTKAFPSGYINKPDRFDNTIVGYAGFRPSTVA